MYDVIVIGAGPAGCTAAKILSERGFKVMLAEKFKLPRNKSCSGQLIGKTVSLVKKYFETDIPEMVMCAPSRCKGMIFTDDKGKEYRFEQDGLNIWRSSFDNFLARSAADKGVEIRDNTSVIYCEDSGDFVTVTLKGQDIYTEKAKYVIDCEGVVGLIKRKLTNTKEQYITTFQTFNKGSIDLDNRYFYAYLQPQLSEYDAWFNVKDDNLIFGVAVKDMKNIHTYYNSFIQYMEDNHNLKINKTERSEKWLMPYIRPDCNIVYGVGRVLFAGETAGFLNPMGEGISSAMESGYAAACSVADNFEICDKVYSDYKQRTADLKTYMQRQWNFVGSIANTFSDMKL